MPCMDDDPDAYVKTISEVLKDPRQDNKNNIERCKTL